MEAVVDNITKSPEKNLRNFTKDIITDISD